MKVACPRGAWLAQSVEHATLDLSVVSSSPKLGAEPTLKEKKKVALFVITSFS